MERLLPTCLKTLRLNYQVIKGKEFEGPTCHHLLFQPLGVILTLQLIKWKFDVLGFVLIRACPGAEIERVQSRNLNNEKN